MFKVVFDVLKPQSSFIFPVNFLFMGRSDGEQWRLYLCELYCQSYFKTRFAPLLIILYYIKYIHLRLNK